MQIISLAFGLTNLIILSGSYASQSCDNINSLIQTYNLSSVTDQDYTSTFYEINQSDNSTYETWEDLIETYEKLNLTIPTSINPNNLTTSLLQTQMLLGVSSNCRLKKATLGLSTIMLLTYVLTSGFTAVGGIKFYNSYKRTQRLIAEEQIPGNLEKAGICLIYSHKWCFPEIRALNDILTEEDMDSIDQVDTEP
ncbi:hypothetical protein FOA43_003556 [Brettanomyces nanus]|uniref:Uncharacterized protein n=1 Tax=Eeniella nana TaxID=13502 RepID=A0A875RQ86_EENNA|nr:uncharacterized protein FOA43_003556 [Brettanomyces nanus]QPG76170.1 hypothetical protein FOA43_003556 [Brettanomyces nanus]